MTALTPEEIMAMPAGDLANRASTELFELRNRVSEIVSAAKKLDEHLDRTLELKYAQQAHKLRLAQGKDTGVIHFDDGPVRVTADLPTEVESILNKIPINDAVIRHWREKARDRKTIVFCSTVAHAEGVHKAFVEAGIGAVLIYGELSDAERKARLHDYESGSAQVVVNVAVLTEGYDYTPTACVVLLRPSSHKSTLTQMIGRGLRVGPSAHRPHR